MTGSGREEHPATCSLQIGLELGARMPASEIRKRMDAFLAGVTDFLRDNGCTLIGHIKGLLDAGETGQLFFSITSFDEGVRYKGAIDDEISAAVLSMNVIVYGIEEGPVETAVRQQLERQFSEHPKK
jgi:hypothetical protein